MATGQRVDPYGNFNFLVEIDGIVRAAFQEASGFSEGMAAVLIDKGYGYIDTTGKIIIEPQFEGAFPFADGIARVFTESKPAYIDKTGKYIWKPTK